MATSTRSAPTITARWENPAKHQLILERRAGGRVVERQAGPRSRLTLEEAAAVLERPIPVVRRSIRTGFLKATRKGPHPIVTVKACATFLAEERADNEGIRRAYANNRGRRPIPAEEVYRTPGF